MVRGILAQKKSAQKWTEERGFEGKRAAEDL
jgi:hypothetical protein